MTSIANPIIHKQSSHCETGVVANMLNSQGLDVSEAMAFGLSGGLAFAYLPFVKISGMPLIAYRALPKTILKGVTKKLGIKVTTQKFSDEAKGMQALDEALAKGLLVGLQTSVYWLPYFPEDMRFHFNAHNLIVYGKNEQGDYLISDPVFEEVVICPAKDLQKARFAKGALAPKGLMYTMENIPTQADLTPHIYSGIKKAARLVQGVPIPGVPFFGVKGIRYLAKQIKALDKKPMKYRRLYLGHIVRMQEEIGTGGAGFRFMFASFLQEASEITGNTELKKISEFTTELGDKWRQFAMKSVFYCKKRGETSLDEIADALLECAELENELRLKLQSLS